jgi:hypothetical protein
MATRIGIALFDDAEELDWAGPWEVPSYWSWVVAARPLSKPASARTNAPVHTEVVRRARSWIDRTQALTSSSPDLSPRAAVPRMDEHVDLGNGSHEWCARTFSPLAHSIDRELSRATVKTSTSSSGWLSRSERNGVRGGLRSPTRLRRDDQCRTGRGEGRARGGAPG